MKEPPDDLRSKIRALPGGMNAPREQGGERDHEEDPPHAQPARVPASLASVFARWRIDGPLIHEAIGLEALDDATGGGPVYGSRWYVLGAPDAGKTAFVTHVAHVYAMRGLAVGLLAVDEEDDDIATRFSQRVGFERAACETRTPEAITKMTELVGSLRLRIYGADWTIEEAAQDLAAYAKSIGARAMLAIDSVQTAICDAVRDARALDRELTEVRTVGLNVQAIRRVATQHKLIAIATSEMSRLAYTTIAKSESEQSDTMGTAKWSGAIEYSARVMISLRNVKGEEDVIALEIPKNKHGGKRLARDGKAIYLEIDRARQSIAESDYVPPAPEDKSAEREAARGAAASRQTLADAAIVAVLLARGGGVTARELRGMARAKAGSMSHGRVDAALAYLSAAVVRVSGERNAQRHHLDGSKLTDELVGTVASDDRTAVIVARPPTTTPEPEPSPPREDAPRPTDDELDAEQDARIENVAAQFLEALAAATAAGAEIRSRHDLLELVRGARTDVKGLAVTRLINTGRIRGGRGKPFSVRRDEPPGLFAASPEPSEAS